MRGRPGPRLPESLATAVGGRPIKAARSGPLNHKQKRKQSRLSRKTGQGVPSSTTSQSRTAQWKPSNARAADLKGARPHGGSTGNGGKRDRADGNAGAGPPKKRARVAFDLGDGSSDDSDGAFNVADDEEVTSDEEERGSALDSESSSVDELDVEDDLAEGRRPGGGRAQAPNQAQAKAPRSGTAPTQSLTSALALSDPAADDDEKLIAQLERKLGMRREAVDGTGGDEAGGMTVAARAKVLRKQNRAFAKEGLGEDFGEYMDGLDRKLALKGQEGGGEDSDGVIEEEEGEEDDDDAEEDDEDEEDDERDDDEGNDDDVDVPVSSRQLAKPVRFAPAAETGKYVPPHLRGKGAAATAGARGGSSAAPVNEAEEEEEKVERGGGGAGLRKKGDLYGRDLKREGGGTGPSAIGQSAGSGANVSAERRAAFFSRDPLADIDLTNEGVLVLKRRVQGLLNRLSEGNVESVSVELSGVYKSSPHAVVNALLLSSMTASLQHETALLRPLALVYAALLGALHVLVGPGVGSAAIERLVLSFAACTGLPLVPNPTSLALECTSPPPTLREGEAAVRRQGQGKGAQGDARPPVPGRTKANLLLMLCYLLHFQVAHPSLLAQLCALLVSRFAESDVELLLLALTYAGWALRADDPAVLRDVLKAVHVKLKGTGALPGAVAGAAAAIVHAAQAQAGALHADGREEEGRTLSVIEALEGSGRGGPGSAPPPSPSARLRILGELLLDLKNNRQRAEVEQLLERASALRKWLTKLIATREASLTGVDRRLRIGWPDLLSIPEMGRWWLVGSSWAGKAAGGGLSVAAAVVVRAAGEAEGVLTALLGAAGGTNSSAAGTGDGAGGSSAYEGAGGASGAVHASLSDADSALLDLARAMRMNTPARRSIFVALMGAEDIASAVDRCLRIALKGPAERDIIRVALDCMGQEQGYNPFFAGVVRRLCGLHPRFKFTTQLALWDCFKVLDDGQAYTMRRVYNLARFTADMILPDQAKSGRVTGDGGANLTLATLKPLPFSSAERGASPSTLLFLKALLSSLLLSAKSPAVVASVFSRVGSGPDKLLVRDGVVVALHAHTSVKTLQAAAPAFGGSASTASSDELKERLRTARRALDAVSASAEDVDEL